MTTILCVSGDETCHAMAAVLEEDLGHIPDIVIISASPADAANQVGDAFIICTDSTVATEVRKRRPDLKRIKTLSDHGYSPGTVPNGFRQAMTNISAELTMDLV